ncbi:uncharacterized protein Dwil_GK10895 [Drosophila willistoni]|uniref:Uncharacterized protein n=1 Tax=Drosophila willistoni TaxID=7260 RepID=B4N9J3_DROWI|nr:uncharacterized protein LOC6647385 [Drosophila willistoni]EDW81669.1 uncharacterized protein Dwil_GK10895 [Drosophila willistoni]
MNNNQSCLESSKKSSHTTLGSTFFEDLWPVLLDENKCRVESTAADYFIPTKKFNQLYWHTFLAKVGYPDYLMPHDLRCCKAAERQDASEEEAELAANEAAENMSNAAHGDYENCGSMAIRRVDKEITYLRDKAKRRDKLAYEFANRSYPWTMKKPKLGFELTPELRKCFKKPMELHILQDINIHNCQLMLIDAGSEICVDDFQRWIKFGPYVKMLVLVRCPRVERRLRLLNVFHTLLYEECAENSWHEELECSLQTGFEHAKKMKLLKDCSESFIFVFSQCRGFCTCDTYKIVRRS